MTEDAIVIETNRLKEQGEFKLQSLLNYPHEVEPTNESNSILFFGGKFNAT